MAKSDKTEDPAKAEEVKIDSPITDTAKTETPFVPYTKTETPKTRAPETQIARSAPTTKPIPARVMYLGPNMAEDGAIFSHGQIFSNGVPPEWQTKALLEPDFQRLLIPVEKVGKALADLQDPNSMLSSCATKVRAAYIQRQTAKKEGKK